MNAGCLFTFLGVAMPRVILTLIFFITNWLENSYDTKIWPILGFIFCPYTTLAYLTAMMNNDHRLAGGWVLVVILGVILDILGQAVATASKGEVDAAFEDMMK